MEHIIQYYKTLHAHPERSRKEYQTAARIEAWLRAMDIEVVRIGETAVIGILKGGRPGKKVALRADMDALPITESTALPYASENEGIMHACGHDFHMAALLGAAHLLSQQREDLPGTVQFIFQPDEEEDGYAALLSAHEVMKDTAAVFGAHVDPTLPAGTLGYRYGKFYASAAKFDLTFIGKSIHGATPQNGADALAAAAATVGRLLDLRESGEEAAMISVGTFQSGTVRNIIADRATLSGIIRAADKVKLAQVHQQIQSILKDIEGHYGVTIKSDFAEGYIGITNHKECTDLVKQQALALYGETNAIEIPSCLMTTEDFGEYLVDREGSFYHIGVGGNEGLHSCRFAPDPGLLEKAATMHAQIITSYLRK